MNTTVINKRRTKHTHLDLVDIGRGPRVRKRKHRVLYHAFDVESWLADPAGHERHHQRSSAAT
jgi:hypothetical protein